MGRLETLYKTCSRRSSHRWYDVIIMLDNDVIIMLDNNFAITTSN